MWFPMWLVGVLPALVVLGFLKVMPAVRMDFRVVAVGYFLIPVVIFLARRLAGDRSVNH